MANARTRKKFDKLHQQKRAERAKGKITMTRIYALYDIVAEAIAGQLILAKHDAQAIRTFTDALSDKQPNIINQHPEDYRLVTLGNVIERDRSTTHELELLELVPEYRIVLEGKQWLAMQEKGTTGGKASDDVTISLARTRE